jgi:hypothetical protein
MPDFFRDAGVNGYCAVLLRFELVQTANTAVTSRDIAAAFT